MHIRENLTNFLYDKNYFISIYDNYIYVYNYFDLLLLTDTKIVLKLEKFNLTINGENLYISKLLPKEILIKTSKIISLILILNKLKIKAPMKLEKINDIFKIWESFLFLVLSRPLAISILKGKLCKPTANDSKKPPIMFCKVKM